ncbi:ATP-binding domain-containing protein [uncultured Corynebacterium sp.]|uniref:HelD family protein n=1 Tax=uncultured Corynebacterium sp. TaxID=159447 RepID=UPI0025DEBEF1|nr:ATP-binding domain-containing protein [uncultured Corynebacterium sp.]
MPDPNKSVEVAAEQAYLDFLLDKVDSSRARLEEKLKAVRLEADIDDPQGLMMRDREARDIAQRLDELSAADIGLMFGRIDVADDDPENPVPDRADLDRRYIGRIGIHDSDAQMRTLLMDWRAPMARPFYLATTLHSDGVHTRRHITTRGRTVVTVADEVLSATADAEGGDLGGVGTEGVATEKALLHAVTRARTEHMRDIVETIAAEQDRIIRSEHRGVTVVQGAPGTGKTAVALHRAAYLLYTWREQLRHTGVLIIGPNSRFLEYISQVLPSLGETGVVLATPGTLLPGVKTVPERSLLAREIKGSIEMVTILRDAVKSWQTVPDSPLDFAHDGVELQITPQMVRAARTKARRSRRPHNKARAVFAEHLTRAVSDQLAEKIGGDPLGGTNLLSAGDRAQLHDDLAADPHLGEVVESLWPTLTPPQVLAELFAHPEVAAFDYDDATLDGLRRTASGEDGSAEWTDADAPLLDELADLLGIVDDEEREAAERGAWLEKISEAQEALDILTGSASQDLDDGFAPEILMAYDVLDAEMLAQRQQERDIRSTAQRATADQRWAFGHVIVDEAQELSAMAWRMIFRRSPNKWMTIVGDPAQTSNPSGVDTWESTLQPFVTDRWQLHELTVNYRTPRDIAQLANELLPAIAPAQTVATALRESGTGIRFFALSELGDAVAGARDAAGEGLVGVIFSKDDAEVSTTVNTVVEEMNAEGSAQLADPAQNIVAVDVTEAKGLEFDEVVLVEPGSIAAASPQGLNDVYVAITRATQGLSVVHDAPLPWE